MIIGASALSDRGQQQETSVTLDGWWLARRQRADQLLDSGWFPLRADGGLNGLSGYGLARHLDGGSSPW